MAVCRLIATTGVAALFLSAQAMAGQARLTISSGKTKNLQCSAGVCAPTATSAVLNVRDLETMLASGNVEVTTTGAGVQANDIQFDAPFSWLGTNTLWLDAYANILIAESITVKGAGGLTLTSGTGNTLFFAGKGDVNFKKLSSVLTINGNTYALVNDIAALAGDIASNPAGDYAFARNYNAARDGTYSEAPITTPFTGIFEGLGHRISNLTIDYSGPTGGIGLFSEVESSPGWLRDIGLPNANIAVVGETNETYWAGALAGTMLDAGVFNAYATGSVAISGAGSSNYVGGLIGAYGAIYNSRAVDSVTATSSGNVVAGGLVGEYSFVSDSYATGSVTAQSDSGFVSAGGLVGCDGIYKCDISNSYATGDVSASTGSSTGIAAAGGLAGSQAQAGSISTSYSTGTAAASGAGTDYAGGSVGWNAYGEGTFTDVYWDTTTSGIDTGVGSGSYSGVTGLTTLQLQSGLPAGFQSSVWREKSKINGGLPYLIANPPGR
jgi:hypothetical protein